jgi:hypothetical protein
VPETPVLDDEGEKKETIKYSIFFPVASTFTPSKGKAEGVDKTKQSICIIIMLRLGLEITEH